jgi:uncharacterized protein YndB with AHSA1/START domain
MASIKHLFHISAPHEKVYSVISTTEGIASWWATAANGESKVGGIINLPFGSIVTMTFKVLELKPNESVKWECISGNDDWIGTIITFFLDENDGKTRVRFEHAGWKETGDHYANCCFSWGRYMESIRQLCQAGKGMPFGS